MKLQSRCQPGLKSSEGLTGTGGSASKMAHSHGCWREASVLHHVDLSIGLLECPHTMEVGFCRSKGQQDGSHVVFYT